MILAAGVNVSPHHNCFNVETGNDMNLVLESVLGTVVVNVSHLDSCSWGRYKCTGRGGEGGRTLSCPAGVRPSGQCLMKSC